MSQGSFLCSAHKKEATLVCLCESNPLFICPACLSKHQGHEAYPISQTDAFQANGRDKEELRRRSDLSQGCQVFLDKVKAREIAVQSEAKAIMTSLQRCYEMWLEGNHRCFDGLLKTLRKETALLIARPRYRVSQITQQLIDKLETMESEEGELFDRLPEIESFMHLTSRCQESISKASKAWQNEYESELQALITLHRTASKKDSPIVPEEGFKFEDVMHHLQTPETDFQAEDEQRKSLQQEIETVVQTQASQLDDYRLSLEQRLKRISELENEQKELSLQLESSKRQIRGLEVNYQNETQRSALLEHLKDSLNKQCVMHVNQLIEDEQRVVELLKKKSELEAQNQELKESHSALIKDFDTKVSISLSAANERKSALESKLLKWGITTDPPTDFQVPDYSTPKSIASLSKFGPYSNEDSELILMKRAPVFEDAGVYIGQWNSRNQKHGYGKYLWKTGDIYEGLWRNGQRTGRGRYIWANNGDVYIGDFSENKREGFGICYYAGGHEYSGTWVNNKSQGIGSFKFAGLSQGNRYIGEYEDGKYHGIGAYFWSDGGMYVGSWQGNKKQGKGLRGWADGQMYFGEFLDDLRSGIGCYLWQNGDVYRGLWKQNNRTGQGRLIHPGVAEQGTWTNNVLQK